MKHRIWLIGNIRMSKVSILVQKLNAFFVFVCLVYYSDQFLYQMSYLIIQFALRVFV